MPQQLSIILTDGRLSTSELFALRVELSGLSLEFICFKNHKRKKYQFGVYQKDPLNAKFH